MNKIQMVNPHQNTKIVATVGPACSSEEMLTALAKSGVNVFRLNFSHGAYEDHLAVMNNIRNINEKYGMHVGILCDLQGPKIRIGKIEGESFPIQPGDILTFVNTPCMGTKEAIYMSYERFPLDVEIGEKILLDDGKVVLEVLQTNKKNSVKLAVLHGVSISSNKGVNLPDTDVKMPALTEKDLRDLDFILQQPMVNWIALSFVQRESDIRDLREIIESKGHRAKIIAKIEKPNAVKRIDEIIKVSNAIMVARGDLGVEMPIEKLPAIQKMIIKKCIQWARPVIVATQMMDSMIVNPSPTRAEVTDVANAVLDGTDAVMLSGETSVGKHPILVVEAMNKIIEEAEIYYNMVDKLPKAVEKSSTFMSDVICFNAAKTADELNAKAIVGMTESGYTAFKISSYRPKSNIYIFSDIPEMLATLNLVWGVRCYHYTKFTTTDETISDVIDILKKENELCPGDYVVNTGTMPLHSRKMTNMLKVSVVE